MGFRTTFAWSVAAEGDHEGVAFVIQNENLGALGGVSAGLGYADRSSSGGQGILCSLAVEFDIFQDSYGPFSCG